MQFDYIDFVIDEDGTLTAEVEGATGPGCETLLDQLLAGLGRVVHRKRKREFYRPAQVGQRERVGRGGRGRGG